MPSLFLRHAARSVRKMPLLLNVAGLALGLAVCAILSLLVGQNWRFNAGLPGAAHVWRLDEHWAEPGTEPYESAWASFRTFAVWRQTAPEIGAATQVMDRHAMLTIGDRTVRAVVTFTDADFLRVLKLRFLRGVASDALAAPDAIVLSDRAARARFGTIDIVGRTIALKDADGIVTPYRITGVFADSGPDNDPRPDYLARMTRAMLSSSAFLNWGSSGGRVFVTFPDRATAARVAARLPGFVARYGGGSHGLGHDLGAYGLSLVNLRDTRFHDLAVEDAEDGADPRLTISLGVVGLLALLIAVLNYVNLATAMAGTRARDTALRKVLGASTARLARAYLAEAVMTAWLAGGLAMALCELAIPWAASLSGVPIGCDYLPLGAGLFVASSLCGLIAGLYPALVQARFRPAAVLAAQAMPGGGRGAARLRSGLVAVQFGLAVLIASCTLVVNAQARFLREADRGYRHDGLLILPEMRASGDVAREGALLSALAQVPGVASVALSNQAPGSQAPDIIHVRRPGQTTDVSPLSEMVRGDYAATYGVRLLAGRWFSNDRATDRGPADLAAPDVPGRAAILNEQASRALGFAHPRDAIGQTLMRGHDRDIIVGVAADMRFLSAREQVKPLLYLRTDAPIDDGRAVVHVTGATQAVMRDRLIAAWRSVLPGTEVTIQTPDALLADQYQPARRQGLIFASGAAIAVAIACIGLYGLTAFVVARRRHEIGVRKVLGASSARIMALLMWQGMRPVLLASLIACPVGWAVMRGWLAHFDQRIALSAGFFVIATCLALGFSALTIASQSLRAARTTPAWALRQD